MHMHILLAALALAVSSSVLTLSASAADVPVKAARLAPTAPVALTATDWTGFYLGGHVGHGWAQSRGTYDDFGDAGPMDFVGTGVIGGAQAGYLWQTGRLVYGVEADASFGELNDGRTDNDGVLQRIETKFLGSARVVTGATIDNILIYGTIGGGYADSRFSVRGDVPRLAERDVSGWGLVSGMGVEMALAPNWSLRAEYLYYDIDKRVGIAALTDVSFPTDFVKIDGVHVARLAANYRFNGVQRRSSAPAANWAGLYVGAHGGYGVSRIVGAYNETNDNGALDFDPNGFVGGAQVGYNFQHGAWVYGLEGDWSWAGMKDDRFERDDDSQRLKTTDLASARARVGIAADNRLYYLTAGWGYARSKLNVMQILDPRTDTIMHAQRSLEAHGVVIGSGVDWALTPNWSVRLEGFTYLFDKRHDIPDLTPASDKQDFFRQSTVKVIRIGANYRFGGPN